MKIIRLKGFDLSTDIDFHPDSALLLPGRPLFYPDFGGEWQAKIYVGVHINRLGKSVSEKFAPRYYDALSFSLCFEPVDSECLLPGVLSGMDSSITYGEWLAPEKFLREFPASVIDCSTITDAPDISNINRVIAEVSSLTTLRMGDIVLLPVESVPVVLSPRSRFVIMGAMARELVNVKIV